MKFGEIDSGYFWIIRNNWNAFRMQIVHVKILFDA